MVVKKPFVWRGLVDLSWDKFNLFNLHKYSRAGPERELNKTAFQLRWRAKQLTVPYHAAQITQKSFRRLRPKILPRTPSQIGKQTLALPQPPTTMLTFAFMERRLDTTIFRACFVRSIWEAHRLCRNGSVTVNGKQVTNVGYLLEDGDIVQLDADRTPLLNAELRKADDTISERELASTNEDEAMEDASTTDQQEDTQAEGALASDGTTTAESNSPSRRRGYASREWGFHPVAYMAPWMFVPEYLEVNYNNLSICFLRSPTIKPGRCEIPSPYDELVHQRSFDYYSRYRRLK